MTVAGSWLKKEKHQRQICGRQRKGEEMRGRRIDR